MEQSALDNLTNGRRLVLPAAVSTFLFSSFLVAIVTWPFLQSVFRQLSALTVPGTTCRVEARKALFPEGAETDWGCMKYSIGS